MFHSCRFFSYQCHAETLSTKRRKKKAWETIKAWTISQVISSQRATEYKDHHEENFPIKLIWRIIFFVDMTQDLTMGKKANTLVTSSFEGVLSRIKKLQKLDEIDFYLISYETSSALVFLLFKLFLLRGTNKHQPWDKLQWSLLTKDVEIISRFYHHMDQICMIRRSTASVAHHNENHQKMATNSIRNQTQTKIFNSNQFNKFFFLKKFMHVIEQ